MKRCYPFRMIALAIILMAGCLMDAQAQSKTSFIEKVDVTDEVVTFQMRKGNYAGVTMTVVGPEDFRLEQHFSGKETPNLRMKTKKGMLPNGAYTIEVTARPDISDKERAALDQARRKGDRYALRQLMKEIGLNPEGMVYSVNLGISKGKFLNPRFEEEDDEETVGHSQNRPEKLEQIRSAAPQIQSVKLTGERWDAAYLPNQPDASGTAVQPAALAAAPADEPPPFLQATANPAAAWYGATFHNTAADGTPLTYQGFLRPVTSDSEGKRFEVHLRKADGTVYGPWQQGYFQADEGVFSAANHAHAAQPFDYLTDENAEAAEASMPTWHTGAGSIDGSLCVGFDCPSTPAFGFDTIRMQENNLRLHFDDTSVTASFPPNDWRVYANDSANGGSSYFGVEDATAGRFVFRVFAGARSNALTVDSDGDVGLGTTTPATDIDIKIGDTPTLRLQQDGTSGFTPQTWDVAGNEAGFFIRDATSGSTLPFRIITGGAPSESLVIDGDGEVGIGAGTNPSASLHVRRTNGTARTLIEDTGTGAFELLELSNTGGVQFQMSNTGASGVAWNIINVGNANNDFRIAQGAGGTQLVLDPSGNLTIAGNISKAGGSFRIDHPLDPANKFLYHSFVESPDMMNVYNGNVTTDARGEAIVEMPEYFEALNRDFRYQLTVIGTFAQAIVGEKIQDNRFVIRTDQPNVEVSWQVTGVRQDAWAEQNRIEVEVDKPAAVRGFYLHPSIFGQPRELGIGYKLNEQLNRQINQQQ